MKIPKVTAPSKKRKGPGGAKIPDTRRGVTLTDHYLNFITSVLKFLNQFEMFRRVI